MPYLVSPEAPVSPRLAPPILRSADQSCALVAGVHALGGRAADAIPLVALENQPRAAILTVTEDGVSTLQRTTASVMVRIDGETVGIAPIELHNGARIEFGECRVTFETDAATATPPASRTGQGSMSGGTTEGVRVLAMRTGNSGIEVTAQVRPAPSAEVATDAALVDVRSGARYRLRARRIYIGRDQSCDVVVHGNGVSRRHASIAPVAGGFMLRDESTNGTLVNGVRVVGTYLLDHGDVVRVNDEELRVELDESEPAPIVRGEMTTQLDLSHITRGVTEEQARAAAANRVLTASLEIVRGPFTGACFQIDRAVCSIGRAEENHVRIRDDTVSLSHATLLRKRGAWFVVDLRSMNGTFVDGSRVSGERELHPGACLRIGAVDMVFRAIDSEPETPGEPPRPGFWARVRDLLRIVGPPSGGL